MWEQIPIDIIKRYVKAPILSVTSYQSIKGIQFCNIETSFGNMTLIIQSVFDGSQKYYHQRKQILYSKQFINLFPLIYQQQIITDKNSRLKGCCLTLTQQIEITNYQSCKNQSDIKLLILCAVEIQFNTSYQLSKQDYQLEYLLKSKKNTFKYFNFTSLKKKSQEYQQSINVQIFVKKLSNILCQIQSQDKDLQQIILVKQKIYKHNYNILNQALYWFQLANWFNFIPLKIIKTLLSNSIDKYKQIPIWKLNGQPIIIYNQRSYKNLKFVQGKCINLLIQMSIQQLRLKFFKQNIAYVLEKKNYAIVKKLQKIQKNFNYNNQNVYNFLDNDTISFYIPSLPTIPDKIPTDTIIIQDNINKIQCINFFITYLNYIKPILKSLEYLENYNTLRLQLKTKIHPLIIIDIIFHPQYIIKDQQISMIIQKAALNQCSITVNKMNISDSLLLFLANSQKMSKIISLSFDRCLYITQNGLNCLLISPYCKNLVYLNVSGLPLSDTTVQAIVFKLKKINNLKLNNCQDHPQQISVSKMKLQSLQAMGLNIQINFQQSLRILKLDCQVHLDNLRNLRNLRLQQLKIKLIDSKKNLMNMFGNFYGKDTNPARIFAQGQPSKTLKILDISASYVKLKVLKAMFNIQSLQTLIIQNYQKIGNQLQPISSKILSVSFKGTVIDINQLTQILQKTKQLIFLNIARTEIKKNEILEFLLMKKIITSTIQLSQQQYTNKFLDKEKCQLNCIRICIQRMLDPQSQFVFNHMLFKAAQSDRTIYLLCKKQNEKILIGKVKKYLAHECAQPPKNIHINNTSYRQILNKRILIENNNQYIQCNGIKVKKWSSDQSINSLTYHLVKTLRQNSQSLLGICIKGNRLLGSQCINMIKQYGNNHIQWLDFRNCLFNFKDVSSIIFNFPFLQKVNQGSYEIILKGQTFVENSQKYLKFFMKIQSIKQLIVQIYQIKQAEILFSVLFHIIDQHYLTLISLKINLYSVKISQQAKNFWLRVFQLKNLKKLVINSQNCQKWDKIDNAFGNITKLNLQQLSLNIPYEYIQSLQFKQLINLQLQYSGQLISDNILGRLLKILYQLKYLKIICNSCINIININKLYINKLTNLQTLQLSFQYCLLKQSSLFDFIQSIKDLKNLKKLQLNISFTTQNWVELLKSIEILKQSLSNCYIKIIAVHQTSTNFVFNRQQLILKGIDIIM